jgi:hypothetical protein
MNIKILKPVNPTYMNDNLIIATKRKNIIISAMIDGCSNDFEITKEELKRIIK